jgi:hypothetical protein
LRALCALFQVTERDLGYETYIADAANYDDQRDDDLGPIVKRSQDQWREVRRFLAHSGTDLVSVAGKLYPRDAFIGNSKAFADMNWLMPEPVELDDLDLTFILDAPPAVITGSEPEARLSLPLHSPGHQYDRYSAAIRYLDKPRLFENRPSYRLVSVTNDSSPRLGLDFSLATYFEKVDVSETLAHEFAAASLDRTRKHVDPTPTPDDLPFRTLIGDPFAFDNKPVLPGVVTLTIRLSPAGATMLLHVRDPGRVAIGGRVQTLLPSGEFQPASIAPSSVTTDLDLWRNMVREYSEELLGLPEHDGSHGVALNYDTWPLYRRLTLARQKRQLRVYFLGLVSNPLSFGTDCLTVAVFDDSVFDSAFPTIRSTNSEGTIIRQNARSTAGISFDEATVRGFLDRGELAPSSAACLTLAWQHREQLLSRSSGAC